MTGSSGVSSTLRLLDSSQLPCESGCPPCAGEDGRRGGDGGQRNAASTYPSSISSLTSWVRLTPPTVRTILAGSFSLPLRRPASIASRTAFSISRCEVMPTFLRNLRRLALKTSSFMMTSGLRFDHTLITAPHEPSSFEARKRSHQSMTQKAANEMALYGEARHARPYAGHPRLSSI